MARQIQEKYDKCTGNVPTEPTVPADWVLLALLTAIAIGLLIFVF